MEFWNKYGVLGVALLVHDMKKFHRLIDRVRKYMQANKTNSHRIWFIDQIC